MIARYAREGFGAVKTIHDKIEPNEAMRFGSLFDCALTRTEDFGKDYAVLTMTVPEAERKALDYISSKTSTTFDQLSKEYIDSACKEAGYYKNWGIDAHYSHLEPYKEYYNLLKSGKTVVSEKDYEDAIQMVRVFRDDEYLSSIFGTKDTEDVEYLYQLKFLIHINIDGQKYKFKFMPDLLVVNHREKWVQPVDLKTSSNPSREFADNFIRMRYDIEASSYTDALRVVLDTTDEYKDYKILPYLFTDISRTDKIALTFEYDPKSDSQRNGFSYIRGDKTFTYKPWHKLLQEIIFYEKSGATIPSELTTTGANDLLTLIQK